jgi:hypothetical protein
VIDSGVPDGPAEWPSGVLDRLKVFCQGDVVRNPPLFYYADPTRPVFTETFRYQQGSEGPEIVLAEDSFTPPYGIITTQTCDIAEEDSARPLRPWVQMSPIFPLKGNKGYRRSLARGRGPLTYLHVPDLPEGEFWVADLRIEYPVEKGWLAFQERIDGFASEEARRRVGERVAWIRQRPALAGAFVEAIQRPLMASLRRLQEENPDLFDEIDSQVEEVAARLDSYLDPSSVQLVLLGSANISRVSRSWFESWQDQQLSRAAELGITLHALDARRFSELSVAEYRNMVVWLSGIVDW